MVNIKALQRCCKNPEEISIMRELGNINSNILDLLKAETVPGINTKHLSNKCLELCKQQGVNPSVKGYLGFPEWLCISVNDCVCHGVPREDKILRDGDTVNLDLVIDKLGLHVDSSIMVKVGNCSHEHIIFLESALRCTHAGIQACQAYSSLYSVSKSIEKCADDNGLRIITAFSGHGVGRAIHEDISVYNHISGFSRRKIQELEDTRLLPGMTITIEPLVTLGRGRISYLDGDKHSVYNADGARGAYWEHTVLITSDGPQILTQTRK